jgi:serine/threonine protein kinase
MSQNKNLKQERRCNLYYQLNSSLLSLNDIEIKVLLDKRKVEEGWGETQTIRYNGTKLFVKRIPLTDVEYENQYSLKNHYRLPLFYNIGINSAGFGPYRELNCHIKTTNWVLAGETSNFPLLYHYRVIKKSGKNKPLDEKEHHDYVKYWNSSKSVDRYIRARNDSAYELLLFIEYFPHVLGFGKWFSKNTDRIDEISETCFETIAFLKSKGIIHMDMQFHNIVTDDEDFYFTDFGLALDRNACSSTKEKEFFKSVGYMDYQFFLSSSSWQLNFIYEKSKKSVRNQIDMMCGIEEGLAFLEVTMRLIQNLEELNKQFMQLNSSYYDYLLKYRRPILEAMVFIVTMYKNNRKNTGIINKNIRQALAIKSGE